ncbi:retrotransposon protein, putative, ty1-copia subclass [Tanacetum coccineum]
MNEEACLIDGKDYDQFVQNYNMHNMGKTIAELHAMLKLHEKGILKKAETPDVLAIREGKIQKDKKKPRWDKRGLRESRKLKHKALSLYMGNGMRAAVKAIRSFDLSPSRNKRVKYSLDSSYLWHCRLGHINKKCMDKLQHDGILQPTHDESLKKCKSCISRNMARKPFPHQVERAKDLLGLLHTDSAPLILNMVPTKKVERTPYEIWHGKAPKMSYLRNRGLLLLLSTREQDFVVEMLSFFDNSLTVQGAEWGLGLSISIMGKPFSPVADIRAIRILLAIAAFYDYEIWQMDVKTTFLNDHLSEDVYMVQLEGFVDPKHPKKVCKLQRSIYGLKQASRNWNKRFDVEIKKIGFTQNLDEPCIYLKASGSNVAFLIFYVDDILLMGNNVTML